MKGESKAHESFEILIDHCLLFNAGIHIYDSQLKPTNSSQLLLNVLDSFQVLFKSF